MCPGAISLDDGTAIQLEVQQRLTAIDSPVSNLPALSRFLEKPILIRDLVV
jgi:hypothetical protein